MRQISDYFDVLIAIDAENFCAIWFIETSNILHNRVMLIAYSSSIKLNFFC